MAENIFEKKQCSKDNATETNDGERDTAVQIEFSN